MGGSLCTTISSGGSNPADTTITHETTVTYSTMSDTNEVVTQEFKILTETSSEVFRVSADHRATEVPLGKLEPSLAGVLLLVEYDGRYNRLWTWLWKYALSRDVFNTVHLGGDWPQTLGLGRGYILAGCSPEIPIDENVLEAKWSGRLLIQAYEERPLMLFEYLLGDIWEILIETLRCGYSRRG